MLNSRLFHLQQNQSRHFSTVLIRTNWYTISCKYSYSSGLTSVTFPNSVTSIGQWAFKSCSGLTSVNISCEDETDFADYVQRSDISSVFHYSGLSGKKYSICINKRTRANITCHPEFSDEYRLIRIPELFWPKLNNNPEFRDKHRLIRIC